MMHLQSNPAGNYDAKGDAAVICLGGILKVSGGIVRAPRTRQLHTRQLIEHPVRDEVE
jgi:hypothetical protein